MKKKKYYKIMLSFLLIAALVLTQLAGAFAEDSAGVGSASPKATAQQETAAGTQESQSAPTDAAQQEDRSTAASGSSNDSSAASSADSMQQRSGQTESRQQGTSNASENPSGSKTASSGEKETAQNQTAKAGEASAIDNSTTLEDGIYTPDDVSFTGGTGRVKITVPTITVTNGKAYADILFSSKSYTKLQAGGKTYEPEADTSNGSLFKKVPVALNKDTAIVGTTTAMSKINDIEYSIHVKKSEPVNDPDTPAVDNRTDLADGVWVPDSFSVSGGTNKVIITCPKVTISDGKAVATIVFSSDKYTQLKANGKIYDGVTDSAANTSTFSVPVALNTANPIIGKTVRMSDPHWISYSITVRMSVNSGKYTEPSGGQDPDPSPSDPTVPAETKDLKAGTWKVKSDTDNRMFYLYPKTGTKYSTLTVKGEGSKKNMTATVTLTGEGYDYLYMGTALEAAKAPKNQWIKAKVVNGYYTYTLPVSALDKNLTVSAHSKKLNSWFEHTIIFYSSGAKAVPSGTSTTVPKTKKKKDKYATSGKQTKFKKSKKKDKVSKYKDDSQKSTGVVNNRTALKDGVYTPDSFSWSGGSGRLAYIKCRKITVTGGKAYATIVFGSSSYDRLKANGKVYSKSGGGLSTFVIPVKLNANNTIIGRTTAMSQPHWIRYTIYVKKAVSARAAKKARAEAKKAAKDAQKSKLSLSKSAPKITGLKYKSTVKNKYAKYFRIFRYNHGVSLLSIDISKNTALYEEYTKNAKRFAKEDGKVEYDEEGKPVARSQHEITEALYKNNVVSYLLVPEKFDVPAGLDKQYIIVRIPAEKSYVASNSALSFLDAMDAVDGICLTGVTPEKVTASGVAKAIKQKHIAYAGTPESPRYSTIIRKKTRLAVLPGSLIPKEISTKETLLNKDKIAKQKKQAETDQKKLETLESRFTALDIPVILDRSQQEKSRLGKKEWIRAYGEIYGSAKKSQNIFEKEVKAEQK
ncbi:hypothetical protein [Hornefia butyriciproducens]|uniref:hypothetical protein n=1 Tax=Hornefia butyriciproducens TaxID=2652293 RepID=UPI0023F0DDC2|nr:hypothetical protein [Hornefia butyriciproducens]MDD6299944.1 hypothetical protein [Hornefia butyriciproducens]